ncbi:MAG: DUF4258 domain-containing protein [Desulfovibrio sp.]|jgi:hypothetical protein|nr:DUF4258 domain-containing protein [Desulfovibrio sp.]
MAARYFTTHALERMEQRDLTRPMVEAVLRHGQSEGITAWEGERRTLCGITVVVDAQHGTVVTAFSHRNPPARRSHKRMSRLAGQHKRKMERDRTNNGGWR